MPRTCILISTLLLLALPTAGVFAEERKSFEPEMVRIPGGSFDMGCVSSKDCKPNEKPVHRVTIIEFEIGKYEVTFGEYMECVRARGCDEPMWPKYSIKIVRDEYYDDGGRTLRGYRHPIFDVSWDNAKQYTKWLSQETGKQYRLPSEAEWEYAARGKTTNKYWWGGKAGHEYANYGKDKCCGGLARGADEWIRTAPVGSFSSNAFGVHDMHGNVREWVEDCWHETYDGAPKNGSAWLKTENGDCGTLVLRGGSWSSIPGSGTLRSANRDMNNSDLRVNDVGFRLARTLE